MTGDPQVGKEYIYTEAGHSAVVKVMAVLDNTKTQYRTFRIRVMDRLNWPEDGPAEAFVGYWYGGPNPHKFAGGSFEEVTP